MIEALRPAKDIHENARRKMHAAVTVEGRIFAETAYLEDDAGFPTT